MASRPILNLAFHVQRWIWRGLSPRTRGVKVMLFDRAGALLLIRNSYGDSKAWVLPGGGVRPWEEPAAAARREVSEEVGIALHSVDLVATFVSAAEGKRDTVHLFSAETALPPRPDQFEIAEARFFALDTLPYALSPATARRIAEHRGERPISDQW